MTDDQDEPTPPVDGPTNYGPTAGRLSAGPPQDPAPAGTAARNDGNDGIDGGPTVAFARTGQEEPPQATRPGESTGGAPSLADEIFDVPAAAETGGRPYARPATPVQKAVRRPAYYVGLGAAVVVVLGMLAATVVVAVVRPEREMAGTARAAQRLPTITTTTTATTATSEAPPDTNTPAAHPLSTATTRIADTTCALPRFDPADDQQAAFYTAAKTCADNAWRDVLADADLNTGVEVVTITSPRRTDCGEITPTSPATHCDGTAYLTPAHLRDNERNGRYPGRYLGVLLREYAGALQDTTGLTGLTSDADRTRLAQQATCLAGAVSGALAGRGAVDANITGEIADRLTTVDAPANAKSWLDKGFAERTPAACNTWTD